jgi:hypothetical protein
MDGRTQLPVIEYMKKKYRVDYVDTVTEPGPIKFLADNKNKAIVESIRSRVGISVEKHGSRAVCLVGHFGCAGNPVDRLEQIEQLNAAATLVESWGYGVEIIKVYVDESWHVKEV